MNDRAAWMAIHTALSDLCHALGSCCGETRYADSDANTSNPPDDVGPGTIHEYPAPPTPRPSAPSQPSPKQGPHPIGVAASTSTPHPMWGDVTTPHERSQWDAATQQLAARSAAARGQPTSIPIPRRTS